MIKRKYYYPTDKYFFITVQPNSSSFGSTVPNGTDKYLKDSSLSISATPNTGYIFSRWSDNDTNASRTVTVIEDKTYTAIFTLPNYTVTYNGNDNTGGNVPIDQDSPYSSGGEVEVLGNTGNLVKTGYTFDGWNTVSGGTGTSYGAGDTFNISGNTTLYALWDLDNYTLTYENNDADGGSTDESYTVNNLPLTLTTPSVLGYGFIGWYLNSSYTGDAVTSIVLNPSSTGQVGPSDLTVYGKWEPRTYTLVFISGNNELLRFENVPYTCSDLSSLTSTGTPYAQVDDLPVVNYDGHWRTQNYDYDIIYTGGGTYMEWDSDEMKDFITASDLYEPNGVVYIRHLTHIIYDGNGASAGNIPSSNYDLVGNSVTVAGNTGNLTTSGCTFNGWNTASDGWGTHYDSGDSFTLGLYSANTLYAEWVATITINYGSNGSYVGLNTTETHTVHKDEVIDDINLECDDLADGDLSEYGLTWDGKFYYDPSFTQLVDEPYTVTLDITFYVNIVDTVKYGIKVKGSGPEDFDTITDVSPFGEGHNYVKERCYTDDDGYYNIATIGYASAFNVYYNDQTIDHVCISSHVSDMSSLYIGHNMCDLTITYDDTSTLFLTAVNGNSVLNTDPENNTYTVICTDHTLTYDFTNLQWIIIS